LAVESLKLDQTGPDKGDGALSRRLGGALLAVAHRISSIPALADPQPTVPDRRLKVRVRGLRAPSLPEEAS